MRHAFDLDGTEHEVWLARGTDGWRLHAGGAGATGGLPVALHVDADGAGHLRVDGRTHPITLVSDGDTVHVFLDGVAWALRHRHPLERAAAAAHHGEHDSAQAPMPGTVVSVATQAGASVRRGEPLLVIESMKLETTIAAPRDGVVEAIHVAPGQVFDRGAVLVTLAAA